MISLLKICSWTWHAPRHVMALYAYPHSILFLPDRCVDYTFLRFRAGCHDLPCDVGKWTHVPRHQHVCSQCSTICDARHLIFECTALDALRVEYACLFSEPHHNMLIFMWQNDMHAVIRFIDNALRMSVLRKAELPPYQPDVFGSV